MKTLFTIILAAATFAGASAQDRVIRQNRPTASFTAIKASGGWDVTVRQGKQQSVSVEISERLLDRAVVEVKNGTLHIYSKSGFSISGWHSTVQKAYVTVTDLERVEASGGVEISFETPVKTDSFELALSGGVDLEDLQLDCDRFKGNFSGGCDAEIRFIAVQTVRADMSGGCDVELCDIAARTTRISASGGCDVELTGKADELILNASGGCDVSASGLTARDCNASFSGAADASIRVTDRLDVTVSGSADVTCHGNPGEVNKKVSKSSSLKFI
ncbi:MAG: DUF2807 domain-containing protein [Proteiniphilum sp.]|jgi:hypothetical protein|nr:DUF2807 domain-containing protein [Proteiniphilum sp.]